TTQRSHVLFHVESIPQHHSIHDQPESAEWICLAFPVPLSEFATLAMKDGPHHKVRQSAPQIERSKLSCPTLVIVPVPVLSSHCRRPFSIHHWRRHDTNRVQTAAGPALGDSRSGLCDWLHADWYARYAGEFPQVYHRGVALGPRDHF